jgi:hypothetical protein
MGQQYGKFMPKKCRQSCPKNESKVLSKLMRAVIVVVIVL